MSGRRLTIPILASKSAHRSGISGSRRSPGAKAERTAPSGEHVAPPVLGSATPAPFRRRGSGVARRKKLQWVRSVTVTRLT